MDAMMAVFQQFISPAEKELSALVTTNGGVKALRNNDKLLLSLEESASKASSTQRAEGDVTLQTKANAEIPNVDDLKNVIFEDPDTAVEKDFTPFLLKFEAQMNQIIIERQEKRTLIISVG
jgi:hypothetical protein